MIFPSIDQMFVWIIWGISSLPNITESVRDYPGSIQALKKVWVSQTEEFALFSSRLLVSLDAREKQIPALHHEIAMASDQYRMDSRWWDEWLNQSGTSDKRKLKLTSSLTLSANSKADSDESRFKSPFKVAGFNRPKNAGEKVPALTPRQAIQYWNLQATQWFASTARTIAMSVGKATSPWIRSMEFEQVESRIYPEFYLHKERVLLSRIRWQQQVRKVTEVIDQWVPFSEEVQIWIQKTAILKNRWSNLLRPISSLLKIDTVN